MTKNLRKMKNQGQALIPVLIILLIALTLGAAVFYLSVGGALLSVSLQGGERTLLAAEGAMENGLMCLLRQPTYTGESLQVNGIDCTINVSGSQPAVVLVACDSGRYLRRLRAEVNFVGGEMQVNNYQEVE